MRYTIRDVYLVHASLVLNGREEKDIPEKVDIEDLVPGVDPVPRCASQANSGIVHEDSDLGRRGHNHNREVTCPTRCRSRGGNREECDTN